MASTASQRPPWVPNPDTLKYGHKRVLALDGGGIRGIILGVVLEYLEDTILDVLKENNPNEHIERKDIFLADYFDVIAGTSTGGLLALYLASRGQTHDNLGSKTRLGLTGEDRRKQEGQGDLVYHRKGGSSAALQMFRANARTIFAKKVPACIRDIPLVGPAVEWLNGKFVSSKYGWQGIETVLRDVFGDVLGNDKHERSMLKLTDLATSVVVPCFNTKQISPFTFFYNSYTNCKRPGFTFLGSIPNLQYADDELWTFTANFPLWQVARATSAAPTFFPVAMVKHIGDNPVNREGVTAPVEPLELIDGGVAANDPAFQAVLLQAKMYGASLKAGGHRSVDWLLPTDFAILSLGTGTVKSAAPQGHGAQLTLVEDLVGKVLMASASDLVHSYFKAMTANLPKGQEDRPEKEREPPCPYLRIQKTDTTSYDGKEESKLHKDVLRREPTPEELRCYKDCLNSMDNISEANMNMLEHIGEFLGRTFTGGIADEGRNLLKDYVREYVLGAK